MNLIKNASETLSVVKGEAGESVPTKLQVVLNKPWIFDIYQRLVMYLMETM
jgi:hypothetical protein